MKVHQDVMAPALLIVEQPAGRRKTGPRFIRRLIAERRIGPPRVFRTALFMSFHAASCRFRYSSWASCGVR